MTLIELERHEVVHRNINLDTVLLRPNHNGTKLGVSLLDFSYSYSPRMWNQVTTSQDPPAGLSPENKRSSNATKFNISHKTDIYHFGLLFYQL